MILRTLIWKCNRKGVLLVDKAQNNRKPKNIFNLYFETSVYLIQSQKPPLDEYQNHCSLNKWDFVPNKRSDRIILLRNPISDITENKIIIRILILFYYISWIFLWNLFEFLNRNRSSLYTSQAQITWVLKFWFYIVELDNVELVELVELVERDFNSFEWSLMYNSIEKYLRIHFNFSI